jgi:hypothetical protein
MHHSFKTLNEKLPEDEKQTLRDLRKETTRRFNEGFLSQDNNGKSIDQVFSEYQERQKMQAVENWLKYCKRPLQKPSIPYKQRAKKVDQLS